MAIPMPLTDMGAASEVRASSLVDSETSIQSDTFFQSSVINQLGAIDSNAQIEPPAGLKLDEEFDSGSLGIYPFYLGIMSDGRILVGDGGLPVRLMQNGGLDPRQPSNPGGRFGGAFGVQDDGKLLIGTDWALNLLNADESGIEWTREIARAQQISHIAVQRDGRVLVAGTFESQGKTFTLSRVTALGALDPTFKPEINGQVNALGLQSDGRILVSGTLRDSNGNSRFLARLNSDGRLDAGFNPAAEAWGGAMVVQPDDRILVATVDQVLRLQADGEVDPTFARSIFQPVGDVAINSITLQADGAIVVGGLFKLVNGKPRENLARLSSNGELDPSFHISVEGTPAWVYSTALDRDGSLLVAGRFDSIGGKPVKSLARLNNLGSAQERLQFDGTKLTWSRSGSLPEVFRGVFDVWTASNQWSRIGEGTRVAGGWQLSNVTVPFASRIRARGYLCGEKSSVGWYTDSYWGEPEIINVSGTKRAAPGGSIRLKAVVNGTQPISYQWMKNGVTLKNDGHVTGANTEFLTIEDAGLQDEGEYLLIASNTFGAKSSSPFAATVDRVYLDESFGVSMNGGASALAIQADGKIVMGGEFTQVQGEFRRGLARISPESKLDLVFNAKLQGSVKAIAIDEAGRLVVGGSISNVAGYARANLVRLSADGALDSEFNPQLDGSVTALGIQKDGKLVFAGDFTSVNGQVRPRLARLNKDGQLDLSFRPTLAFNLFYPLTLVLDAEGGITVLGYGAPTNGVPPKGLVRLLSDGSVAPGFENFTDQMGMTAVYRPDGTMLVDSTIYVSTKFQFQNHVVAYRLNGEKVREYPTILRAEIPVYAGISLGADGSSILMLSPLPFSVPYATLAYYNAQGQGDPGFDPSWRNVLQATGIWSLGAMASDQSGDLLVAAPSNSPGYKLLKLKLGSTGSHEFGYSSSQLRWVRSGKVPEFWRVTFEYSADGVSWSILGDGVWSAEGWIYPRFNLLENGWVRTRGYMTGGNLNGSSWYVEKSVQIKNSPPEIVLSPGSPSWQSGVFSFQVAGAEGQWVLVEESNDLKSWRAFTAKRLAGTSTWIETPADGELRQRFYRVSPMP